MRKSKFITAKELAGILECTPRNVRRESVQKTYQIDKFRDKFEKPQRWFREPTIESLRAQGKYIEDDDDD